MHPNEKLIHTFYTAFQSLDGDTMASCYHEDIRFSDPAFPDLRGEQASGMWKMLCRQAKDFSLEYSETSANDETGSAHWDATYTFSVTGRKVVNRIDAKFEFKDGLIIRHTDHFDFHKWSKMALGTPGYLLGWSGFLQKKVQTQANGNLQKFMAKNA